MTTNAYALAFEDAEFVARTGHVREFLGLVIEADGPDAGVGEVCRIRGRGGVAQTLAEVVGIRDGRLVLMPYGDLAGIRLGSRVEALGRASDLAVGPALLGRVIDGLGEPLDGKGPIAQETRYPLSPVARNPLERPRITEPLETGAAAVDLFTPLGRGQRIGIFSGSGVGKSVLLGMIARNTSADICVIAHIGERGREVSDFIADILGGEALARSVVVAATSDQSPLLRCRAALAATAIAEYFRDQGQHVLLTMDSVTRFAMAQREIGLAIGEPATARGYTPSVFAKLPLLLERGGPVPGGGSITGIYSVLVEADDLNDPIGDHIRAILDGHIVLSRDLANQGHRPAIDLLKSQSRLADRVTSPKARAAAKRALALLDVYEAHRDVVQLGAYRSGSNRQLDRSLEFVPKLRALVAQDVNDSTTAAETLAGLEAILARTDA